MNEVKGIAAILYVRVSSDRQVLKGDGLDSQAHRLRQYAEARGLPIENMFSDDMSAGGDPMERPGMVAMLSFLRKNHKKRRYVIIFDDLKRFARNTVAHWTLRGAIQSFGASVESPNYRFDESPEGEFAETIFAAQGQLERKQNRRQVIQKMTARIERGFDTMFQGVGYRYDKDKSKGGKVLVRDEPAASIVQEALEGFASGRFPLLVDVVRFLESHPEFPLNKNGKVHPQNVSSMLRRVGYAGMIERPQWGIARRKAQHEPLISYETFLKIQDRLDGRPNVPDRKDRDEDFPLRGFVNCGACGSPYTSSWSKSRNGERHPYYHCFNKNCDLRRKTVRRDVLETEFETFVRALEPDPLVFEIAEDMFKDAWDQRASQSRVRVRALKKELENLDGEIDQLQKTVIMVRSQTVMATFEAKIEELENQKLVLSDRMAQTEQPRASFDESLRTALAFLEKPWKLWAHGDYEHKRLLLQLAFSKRIEWVLNQGLRTAELSLPFRALASFSSVGEGGGGGDWIRTSVRSEAGRFTVCWN